MKPIDDISLAQWSLIEEWRAGKWKTLDFPRLAREDFNLNGIELVNTLLEVPTETYLKQLKQNAAAHGVNIVLIMIDEEGDGCAANPQARKEFVVFHRKWVDIAHYLGCHAIRTNCRGSEQSNKPDAKASSEALNWAAESYHPLLEYAKPAGIKILIENHGGVSNDADWMVELMKKVDDPFFGTYPDWREPAADFDNLTYLAKTLPYAKGMSYRNQPTDELSIKMLELCREKNFHGWYGIESTGRAQIQKAINLLRSHLE
jgi:L-ribulose-5-phosphate 3-epimerase